jgi:hypothetical protein
MKSKSIPGLDGSRNNRNKEMDSRHGSRFKGNGDMKMKGQQRDTKRKL